MVDLSSCYFCARAVDAPLQEYAIGPSASESRTVVLCRPCRQKLDPLLEPFRETAQQSSAATRTDAGGIVTEEPEAVFNRDTNAGTDAGSGAIGGTEAGASANESPTGGDGPQNDEHSGGVGRSRADENASPDRSDSQAHADSSAPSRPPGPADADTDTTSAEDADSDADADSRSPQKAADDDAGTTGTTSNPLVTEADDSGSEEQEAEADDEGVTIDPPVEQDADPSSTDPVQSTPDSADPSPGKPTEDTSDTPLSNVSTSTYNRVIRLLQNREFPVVRDEFEQLASNAYQIDRTDCSTALDAAIQKDLLTEENGLLKRPE